MAKVSEALDSRMSRRQLMWMTGLGSLGLLIGPRTAAAEEADPEEQMNAILDSVASLHSTEPGLEGFEAALLVTSAAFADRTDEETDLLAGRIYYQAVEALRQAGQNGVEVDLSGEALVGALSTSPDTDGLDRGFFDDLLADTQARIEVDSDFATAIANSSSQARRESGDCYIGEKRVACWLWWLLVGLVIVAFIILVVAALILVF